MLSLAYRAPLQIVHFYRKIFIIHMDLALCILLVQQMECVDLESVFGEDRAVLLKVPESSARIHCVHNLCVDFPVIA
jgi:hypothetical protein